MAIMILPKVPHAAAGTYMEAVVTAAVVRVGEFEPAQLPAVAGGLPPAGHQVAAQHIDDHHVALGCRQPLQPQRRQVRQQRCPLPPSPPCINQIKVCICRFAYMRKIPESAPGHDRILVQLQLLVYSC